MSRGRAVQFGAGNIGRGFMGQLFWEAGYATTFIDIRRDLITLLNERRAYPLRLLDAYTEETRDLTIDQFDACSLDDREKTLTAFAEADVAGTAVGANNLVALAPAISAGIEKRFALQRGPIDVYLCENTFGAGDLLKRAVEDLLDAALAGWAEKNIGFVGTSVARMVPAASGRFGVDDPLFVVADSYHRLPYDGTAARAPEPPITGMKPVGNFEAEYQRKLFTHNLGHAVLGYVGYLKGFRYVHEALRNPELARIFDGALDETSEALVKRYPGDIDAHEHAEIRKDVRVRFGNPLLLDSLRRVARDPMRKLRADERLIKGARMCIDHDVAPKNIAVACGAALLYSADDDPSAVQLQEMIAAQGVERVFSTLSGMDPESTFGRDVLAAYADLAP